jgi:hypothetical protein
MPARIRDFSQYLADGAWLTRRYAITRGRILLILELGVFLFFVAGTNGLIVRLDRPVSVDFVSFYAAGSLAASGTPEVAYDQASHFAAEQRATEPGIAYQYFFYPPVFLLLCRALAMLPYMLAFVAFEALTLALFLLSIRAVLSEHGWAWTIPVLASPAVFWTLGLGQNSFLTAALLGAGTVLLDRRPVIAGLLFGTLCYKPHFGLLVPVALVAGRHWRAVAAASGAVVALCLASLLLFGLETWQAYLVAFTASPELYAAGQAAKFSGQITPFGAALLLGLGPGAAREVQLAAAVVSALLVWWIWRNNASLPVRSAALILATLTAVPLALLYDLTLSLVAVAWLIRGGRAEQFLPYEKAILAVTFLVPLYQIQISELTHLSPAPIAIAGLLALSAIRAHREFACASGQTSAPSKLAMIRSRVSGRSRMRTPSACATALPIAPAVGPNVASPSPAAISSGASTSSISTSGISLKRRIG